MTRYILAIQIGPMQDFIKAARRTRDLWYGSWLMSSLSKAVAKAIADGEAEHEKCLIFPVATAKELDISTDFSVANKIVALIEQPPKIVAKKAEDAMQAQLRRTMMTLEKKAQKKLAETAVNNQQFNSMWDVALAQVGALPEFYWVALPLADLSQYKTVRLKVEGLLAARKNCRNFQAAVWQAQVPKSSLSGALESVIHEDNYPDRAMPPKDREEKIKALYNNFRARGAERLSGVDLLKRLGRLGEEDSFPSTSHLATGPLRHRLRNANGEVKKRWDAYVTEIKELHLEVIQNETIGKGQTAHKLFGTADGSLLFESRLRDYFDKDVPKKVQSALKKFYALKEVPEPLPYYAILLGDGDFMGRTLNQLETPEAHRRFSELLAEFAGGMKGLIEGKAYGGALVYAGGDDVMALLPLHTAVSCAQAIKKAFDAKMEHLIMEINELPNQTKLDKKPTFSAGIAIAHHLEPLEDALELARNAEKKAKDVPDKNALAISLDKRSGVTRTVVGKWEPLAPNLEKIVQFYRDGELPHGLPYHLQMMVQSLGGEEAIKRDPDLLKVVQAETVRIVKRKQGEMVKEVKDFLDQEAKGIGNNGRSVTTFLNELIIANLLAKAKTQSEEVSP
ncbi:type III-B CRISPR-associated protein Cas10/Cmr2 [Candidatus Leptofilum sp.]|uniref:type III-B CRISPR-associated protein Cas10/Cmr2 n=1 Tax=Candidatus Leptofilum sp. TaxID=3241576 RepID=UPI003B5A69EE